MKTIALVMAFMLGLLSAGRCIASQRIVIAEMHTNTS
jgi:hypothetical protein